MTIKTQSQAIKHQGSALRRTATAVRNLASSIKEPARMQKLLDAAAIIDAEAGATMQRASKHLADEKRYEAAKAKAWPLARDLVKQLPMSTTAEKLAIMDEGYIGSYMRSRITNESATRPVSATEFQRELNQALEDVAQTLAHTSARTGQPPKIDDHLLMRLQRQSKHRDNTVAAALFDRINTPETAPC